MPDGFTRATNGLVDMPNALECTPDGSFVPRVSSCGPLTKLVVAPDALTRTVLTAFRRTVSAFAGGTSSRPSR